MTLARDRTSWPDSQPTLSDGVIRIRPWASDDAAWVFEACQDPDIQRWTTVPVPYAMSDAEKFVGKVAPDCWADERGAHFAIVDANTEDKFGCVGLDVFDVRSGVGEAGFWSSLAARGSGVTTRALKLLTDWSFESIGLVRLELLIEVENIKSKAVAERVGYSCEGVMAKRVWRAGAHRDVALFARTT